MVIGKIQLSVLFFRFSGSTKQGKNSELKISEYSMNLLILIYLWIKIQSIVICHFLKWYYQPSLCYDCSVHYFWRNVWMYFVSSTFTSVQTYYHQRIMCKDFSSSWVWVQVFRILVCNTNVHNAVQVKDFQISRHPSWDIQIAQKTENNSNDFNNARSKSRADGAKHIFVFLNPSRETYMQLHYSLLPFVGRS
jgi:hypothetical protein